MELSINFLSCALDALWIRVRLILHCKRAKKDERERERETSEFSDILEVEASPLPIVVGFESESSVKRNSLIFFLFGSTWMIITTANLKSTGLISGSILFFIFSNHLLSQCFLRLLFDLLYIFIKYFELDHQVFMSNFCWNLEHLKSMILIWIIINNETFEHLVD